VRVSVPAIFSFRRPELFDGRCLSVSCSVRRRVFAPPPPGACVPVGYAERSTTESERINSPPRALTENQPVIVVRTSRRSANVPRMSKRAKSSNVDSPSKKKKTRTK